MTKPHRQILTLPSQRQAWKEVADNEGAAGAENVSFSVWQRTREPRLVQLAAAVRAGRFRPGQMREPLTPRFCGPDMHLPRIPTITGRLLQRAVFQILQPVSEARFLNRGYGYRSGRGLPEAVFTIARLRLNPDQPVTTYDVVELVKLQQDRDDTRAEER